MDGHQCRPLIAPHTEVATGGGRAGRRRLWHAPRVLKVRSVVVVVGILLAALFVFELARPRDYLTGSNNAGADGAVVHVDPGQRLCVGDLHIPKGTGRLRLRIGPAAATTVAAAVRIGPGVQRSRVTVPPHSGPPGSDPAELELPAAVPVDTRGRVCLTASGPIDVAGRRGLEPGQTAAIVAGAAVPARVAVWYLPPAGERKSVLAQLPDMFDRAARLRPGVVGPWTYAVILLLVTPALLLTALWLFARAAADRALRGGALIIGIIGFAAAASWSLIVPVFDAPDEVEHVAYAQAVAEQGRGPDTHATARRPYSTELQVGYESARLSGFYGQRLGRPPWEARDEQAWRSRVARERPRAHDGAGWITTADYTPLYYAALAPAYKAAGGSIWSRVTAMRLVSALLGGIAAAFVVLLVAELLARPRWPAIAAGLLVAFQPMFAFISGVVNNDAGVNAAAAIAVYLVVRALRRGLDARVAVALGVTAALMPLLKGNGLFLLPAIAVGVGGAALRARAAGTAIGRPLAAMGGAIAVTIAVAVAGSAALHHSANPTAAGWFAKTGNAYPTLPGPAVQPSKALQHPIEFAQYVSELVIPPLPGATETRPGGGRFPGFHAYIERGWGAFGFLSILFPKWVYGVISVLMLALVPAAVVAWRRNRGAVRARNWELAVLVLVILGVFFGTEVAYFAPGDPTVPEFGRYLFPAAGPLAALAVLATFGLGRRRAAGVAAGLVTAMVMFFWAAQMLTMSALYT